jgi:hypothetical protein
MRFRSGAAVRDWCASGLGELKKGPSAAGPRQLIFVGFRVAVAVEHVQRVIRASFPSYCGTSLRSQPRNLNVVLEDKITVSWRRAQKEGQVFNSGWTAQALS